MLAGIATAEAALWHDDTDTGFATVGRKSLPVRSKPFRQWLTHRYRQLCGKVPNAEALGNAVHAVEAAAVFDGPLDTPHVRVAGHGGAVYVNLADADQTVVEIGPDGWPKRANGLSGKLRRLAPDLRSVHGLTVELDGRAADGKRSRVISVTRLRPENDRDASSVASGAVQDRPGGHPAGRSGVDPGRPPDDPAPSRPATNTRVPDDPDGADDESRPFSDRPPVPPPIVG